MLNILENSIKVQNTVETCTTFRVKITKAEKPIQNANIYLNGFSLTPLVSNANGIVEFKNVPYKEYRLLVAVEGNIISSQKIKIDTIEKTVNIEMPPSEICENLMISVIENKEPVPNANVYLNGFSLEPFVTNLEGVVRFNNIPYDEYGLIVTIEENIVLSQIIKIDSLEKTVEIDPNTTSETCTNLKVFIKFNSFAVVLSQVKVFLRVYSDEPYSVIEEAEGVYVSFQNVPYGEYWMSIYANETTVIERKITVTLPEETKVLEI